mgnify:CR=1 FL=1
MLIVNRRNGDFLDEKFVNIPEQLPAGAVLVLNNSKVRKARFFAQSDTGGNVEFILLRKTAPKTWEAIVSKSKRQKIGKKYTFPGGIQAEITGRLEKTKTVQFSEDITDAYVDQYGSIPLPPYIKRNAEKGDDRTYQTVYADRPGSAAAPTAGLHFTEELLQQIAKKDIQIVSVTLHVGIGTFLPIRTESIYDHKMHEEEFSIGTEAADIINTAKKENRPVIAVGTTSVRTLESAWKEREIYSKRSATNLYIYPGYEFNVTDGLITNFHTPESSLFVMVSAFAGLKLLQRAYAHAVEQQYRFFSYGDAMYIPPLNR